MWCLESGEGFFNSKESDVWRSLLEHSWPGLWQLSQWNQQWQLTCLPAALETPWPLPREEEESPSIWLTEGPAWWLLVPSPTQGHCPVPVPLPGFTSCCPSHGHLLEQLFSKGAQNWDSNGKIYITGHFTKSSFMNIARLICLVRCREAIKSDWLKTIKTVKVNCLCPLKPAEAVSWKLWASTWKLKLLISPLMYGNIRVLICFVFTGWKPLRWGWREAFNKLFWWS